MKYNIVFSLPVHEKFEVITDQLLNILTLNPNCAVVLHLSPSFNYAESAMSKEEFGKVVGERFADQVFINSESVRTGWFDIIQAHLANFKYISSLIDFEYFSLIASNELFIRKGLYDKIKFFDCGLGGESFMVPTPQNVERSLLIKTKHYCPSLKILGETLYIGRR